jgi:hypothetical protein
MLKNCATVLLLLFIPNSLEELASQVKAWWEQSGNGSVQRVPDSDDIAGDIEEPLIGDDRSNFLGESQSHILYFWNLMDEHQLLASTIGLPEDRGASTEYVSLTEHCHRPRQKNDTENKEDTESRIKLCASVEFIAQSVETQLQRDARAESRSVTAELERKEREARAESRSVTAELERKEREARPLKKLNWHNDACMHAWKLLLCSAVSGSTESPVELLQCFDLGGNGKLSKILDATLGTLLSRHSF